MALSPGGRGGPSAVGDDESLEREQVEPFIIQKSVGRFEANGRE